MGVRGRRARRAFQVTRVARQARLFRALREIGLVGDRPATREGAREFRLALEELGTTWIKLGQLLSSRPDLMPDLYIEELGKLVDEVPPSDFAEIKAVIAAEIGLNVFARLDPEPIATASIGQVHGGLLRTGREVVVKVRRPGVVEQVQLDLDLMRSFASLVADFDDLVVPEVIRPYVTESVLVLEQMEGVKIEAAHGLEKERAQLLAR